MPSVPTKYGSRPYRHGLLMLIVQFLYTAPLYTIMTVKQAGQSTLLDAYKDISDSYISIPVAGHH